VSSEHPRPPGPKIGSLCSGYGGLDLAVEAVLGGRLCWYAETDRHAQTVLGQRWPGVVNLGDIREVDWTTVEPVDVLTAGFPCQDISNAGKRAGIRGRNSSLWSVVAQAVRTLQPGLVYVENVAALRSRGLDVVLGDLAKIGYDTRWVCVRASDVGAAHRRDRLFLLAAPADRRRRRAADTADAVRP
jgi:DNA (cytosine-5)-methyltransferase 1